MSYSTVLLRHGWGVYDETIKDKSEKVSAIDWHMPYGRAPVGIFDIHSALMHGKQTARVAATFPKYLEVLQERYPHIVHNVYVGSFLGSQIERVRLKDQYIWEQHIHEAMRDLIEDDRYDVTVDMSAPLDGARHPGHFKLIAWDIIKQLQGRRLFTEGPRPLDVEREPVYHRHVCCLERDWARAEQRHGTAAMNGYSGLVVRIVNGHTETEPVSTVKRILDETKHSVSLPANLLD
jgi:hypothetical protein